MNREEALANLRAKRAARHTGINPPMPEVKEEVPVSAPEPEAPAVVVDPVETTAKPDLVRVVNAPKLRRSSPPKEVAPESAIRNLYVGCTPVRAAIVYFHDYIAPIAKQVAEDQGVAHWSLCQFGSGPGILADAVRRAGFSGNLVIRDRNSAEARAVIQTLSEMATEIVVA